MANKNLFKSNTVNTVALAKTDARNHAGNGAYALAPKHALAQLAVTGCLNQTYYVDAETQLREVLDLCMKVDSAYVAKLAVYARRNGHMKDMPALLVAYLAAFDGAMAERVFNRVIDNGKMLRNFVQIMRSGAVVRTSLGSRPKRLVQRWLQNASDAQLISASIGNAPSLADVIKMVHPKASSTEQDALFAYFIGKTVETSVLPAELQKLIAFRADCTQAIPNVPFQLLTSQPLSPAHWTKIAEQMSWHETRMNLNTLERHGVFTDSDMVGKIAARLRNRNLIQAAKAFPYQLLAAYRHAEGIPHVIKEALAKAVTIAAENVPALPGKIAIALDVSGSMSSPVTGYRKGASTALRCVDVAGLMTASILSANPDAIVLPFNDLVRPFERKSDSVLAQAEALASLLGGGTNVSAPLHALIKRQLAPDVVIIFSDNQSWIDYRSHGASEVMECWAQIKKRNPRAKLICVDVQPYTTSQAKEGADVLNIGGFSDAVFRLMADFVYDELGSERLVKRVEAVSLEKSNEDKSN
jgi:60 kDa SS-A/Ro ribonucleoprotein